MLNVGTFVNSTDYTAHVNLAVQMGMWL